VFCARDLGSEGRKVAVKAIQKSVYEGSPALAREIELLASISHHNVIQLHDAWLVEDHGFLYMVLELAEGVELFDAICEAKHYSEVHAAAIVQQLMEALAYLHTQHIAHRDVKAENVLLTLQADPTNDAEPEDIESFMAQATVKLIDFGLAKRTTDGLTTPTGTLGFKAPELLDATKDGPTYNEAVDCWAAGVLTYIMLAGVPPFLSDGDYTDPDYLRAVPFWYLMNNDTEQIRRQIRGAEVSFPDSIWAQVSEEARDFVSSLLVQQVQGRMSAAEATEHDWFLSLFGEDGVAMDDVQEEEDDAAASADAVSDSDVLSSTDASSSLVMAGDDVADSSLDSKSSVASEAAEPVVSSVPSSVPRLNVPVKARPPTVFGAVGKKDSPSSSPKRTARTARKLDHKVPQTARLERTGGSRIMRGSRLLAAKSTRFSARQTQDLSFVKGSFTSRRSMRPTEMDANAEAVAAAGVKDKADAERLALVAERHRLIQQIKHQKRSKMLIVVEIGKYVRAAKVAREKGGAASSSASGKDAVDKRAKRRSISFSMPNVLRRSTAEKAPTLQDKALSPQQQQQRQAQAHALEQQRARGGSRSEKYFKRTGNEQAPFDNEALAIFDGELAKLDYAIDELVQKVKEWLNK